MRRGSVWGWSPDTGLSRCGWGAGHVRVGGRGGESGDRGDEGADEGVSARRRRRGRRGRAAAVAVVASLPAQGGCGLGRPWKAWWIRPAELCSFMTTHELLLMKHVNDRSARPRERRQEEELAALRRLSSTISRRTRRPGSTLPQSAATPPPLQQLQQRQPRTRHAAARSAAPWRPQPAWRPVRRT